MVPFIDMHCDTLTQANMHFQHDVYQLPLEMLDVVKLKKGGAKVQFFAVCLMVHAKDQDAAVERIGLVIEVQRDLIGRKEQFCITAEKTDIFSFPFIDQDILPGCLLQVVDILHSDG